MPISATEPLLRASLKTMQPRHFRLPLPALLVCLALTPLSAQQNRIAARIDARMGVVPIGHVHPRATLAADRGAVEDSFAIPGMTLTFKLSSTQQAALDRLLAQQQDPSSPQYHQWLTPEQYADRFGLSPEDLQQVREWAQSQGFAIAATARSRTWISLNGAAGQVRAAFRTPIHHYSVDGTLHYANSAKPEIPAALADVVSSVMGLHDFRLKPRLRTAIPDYNSTNGGHYIAPGDLATIYNITPLYAAGIDGAGQKVAVVGQTTILTSDIANFRSKFNLPPMNLKQQLYGQSPGLSSNDLLEADLDLEWAGAVARNAQIIYVFSNDVLTSAMNAIDSNLAPVLSMSYGLCEQIDLVDLPTFQSWAQQANAQGITWVNASGDNGAADCEITGSDPAQTGLAVDEPASIPEVTAMGGAMFNEGGGSYWNVINATDGGSATSYIPETVWNENSVTYGLAAGGGGHSVFFTQPSWQTGPGVPSDGFRHVPDLSFNSGSQHDATYVYSGGGYGVGGTSAATPVMAGVLALLNQYLTSHTILSVPGLANINPTLYRMAQNSPGVFHDITTGNNSVSCVVGSPDCATGTMGYSAAPGYDMATGLGSIDVNKFVTSWAGSPAVSAAVVASIDQNPVFQQAPDYLGNQWSFTLTLTEEAGIGATLTAFTIDGVSYTSQIASLFGTSAIPANRSISTNRMGLASVAVPKTVMFVFSGVDANGQPWTVQFGVPFAGPQTQLYVGGVANAASYQQAYAPGMLIAVFGAAMGDFVQAAGALPLPQYMAGFEAYVNGNPAPLWYVSPGQVNIQIPYEVPTSGTVTLTVGNPWANYDFQIRMSQAAPGIFTFADGTVNPMPTAARGQTVTLYITGEGNVTPSLADGSSPSPGTPISQLPRPVLGTTVTVAGILAQTAFVGIPIGCVGVTQINYVVPASAPLGDQLVVVKVGTASSLPAHITVTNAVTN
jgi:uncharacterized protein (TIGR03437 family)